MQILEMTFTVDHRGGMRIPAPVLAKMGLTAGDHVRVAYLTHDSVSNTFCELMLLPDADDETAAEKASVIHLPAELKQQASIPQDADLQITCLNGCIVINRDTGFQPEELYPILENLQTAEALASMLPGEAQKTLAKLEQTIERIQKGAEQDE